MQSANLSGPLKGLRPYQALIGPTQASGLAGGFDSAAQRPPPPFGISMLGAGRAAPAQFPACGREFTRHSARGPEGPLGGISSNGRKAENIGLNCPSTSEQSPLCSDVFYACGKKYPPTAPLLLLSNCDPLRWTYSWDRSCAAVLS